jgi:cell division protein ZapE
LKKQFLRYCLDNKFQQNEEQLKTLELLIDFNKKNFSNNILFRIFTQPAQKLGFYLHGDVGVGKTMLLNFYFNNLIIPKKKMHFNEFMINFHDFRHTNKLNKKDNSIDFFVKELKQKIELIYLDEFQVTNIVDAMILGRLFECIFKQNIKVLISSNIKIIDLYKDGLQREQFIPFIKIIEKFCIEHQLEINQDYRRSGQLKLERYFHPLDEQTIFQVNQIFRQLTKNKKKSMVKLEIKGRLFTLNYFFEGVARFNFKELCEVNFGAEDYIAIADKCNFVTIDDIPNFNDEMINQQQRFITLVDVFYEKKISMMVSSNFNLNNYTSSRRLAEPYKRTISRLFELTSPNFNKK